MRFILSLRLYSSFITSRPSLFHSEILHIQNNDQTPKKHKQLILEGRQRNPPGEWELKNLLNIHIFALFLLSVLLIRLFSERISRCFNIICEPPNNSVNCMQQGTSEPVFYVDLVFINSKESLESFFLNQFKKIINHYKRVGYGMNIMWQYAGLVINPITIYHLGFVFNSTTERPQTQ